MDLEIFKKIILANELGGDRQLMYRFSDPDGPAGRSGYSFGLCQFDVAHNPAAILCLQECEFTTDEIAGLRSQTVDVGRLGKKLAAHADVVDRWDDRQLKECVSHPVVLCDGSGIAVTDEAMYHLADYHNQFYMSRGGKMHRFLQTLQWPARPMDILDFKLGTAWGAKRPDDVYRRYDNITNSLDLASILGA